MKAIPRFAWLASVIIVLVGLGYLFMFAQLWGLSGTWPTPYWSTSKAQAAAERLRRDIQIGMTEAEAEQIARDVGAQISVGFIREPNDATTRNANPQDAYLGVGIALITSTGPSALWTTVIIRNGVVSDVHATSEIKL